jgi:hypothetical protein
LPKKQPEQVPLNQEDIPYKREQLAVDQRRKMPVDQDEKKENLKGAGKGFG